MNNFDKNILKNMNIVERIYYLKEYDVGIEIYWLLNFLLAYSNSDLFLFMILLVGKGPLLGGSSAPLSRGGGGAGYWLPGAVGLGLNFQESFGHVLDGSALLCASVFFRYCCLTWSPASSQNFYPAGQLGF